MATKAAYKDAPVSGTCPDIDRVIAMIEDLRKANAQLREWGADLYDDKVQVESDLSEAKDRIGELESEVELLRMELDEAKSQAA